MDLVLYHLEKQNDIVLHFIIRINIKVTRTIRTLCPVQCKENSTSFHQRVVLITVVVEGHCKLRWNTFNVFDEHHTRFINFILVLVHKLFCSLNY